VSACGMCSITNARLFKRFYMNYKIYVCRKCTLIHQEELDTEEKANDNIN